MRSQYILIAALIIISILSYYYLQNQKTEIVFQENLFSYAKNFEKEILYISKNFNKSKILNFILVYRDYLIRNSLEMDFICIVSEKYYDGSIVECNGINKNCCYIIKNPVYIKDELKYCEKSFLYNEFNLICICYNISKENNFYSSLICT